MNRPVSFDHQISLDGCPMAGFGVGFKFQPWKGVGKFVATAVKNEPVTHFVSNIAKGKSFKESVLSAVKGGVHEFQTVAPIAESIVSFVPGIGTAASMALAAGVALSKGQKITDVILSTVKGALPGGPVTATAFDTATQFGEGLLKHESLGKAALGAVRTAAVDAGSAVGIPSQLTESAFDAGLALAHGKKLQEAGFAVLGDLAKGNNAAEKAINFGHALVTAKATGKHVADVLIKQATGAAAQAILPSAPASAPADPPPAPADDTPVDGGELGRIGVGEIITSPVKVSSSPSPWTVALVTTVLGAATGWGIEEVARRVRGRR